MQFADVAELADALDSGSSARKGVEVQVLSSALVIYGVFCYRREPRFFVSVLTAVTGISGSSGSFDELLPYSGSPQPARFNFAKT